MNKEIKENMIYLLKRLNEDYEGLFTLDYNNYIFVLKYNGLELVKFTPCVARDRVWCDNIYWRIKGERDRV